VGIPIFPRSLAADAAALAALLAAHRTASVRAGVQVDSQILL
jgi:hypothetical protein